MRSSYGTLANYVSKVHFIQKRRRDPRSPIERVVVGLMSRVTFTRWYRLGSANMEWEGCQELRRGFAGVTHILWADSDLGFLDLVRHRQRQPLCATFHCCHDTLPTNINFPARLRGLDAIILMSHTQRAFFEAYGVPSHKIHIVPLGIDTDFFRPALTTLSPQSMQPSMVKNENLEHFTVLSVGNYLRNFPLLQEVCSLLSAQDVKCTIIAPEAIGPMFKNLPNVEFRFGLSNNELVSAYQNASCFLMTAIDATANNAILEAMACGVPIVTERVGGIPEYVNEDCAILTEPGRAAPLVEAIAALRGAPEQRWRMAQAARQRAEELAWPRIARQTQAIYRSLLS